MIVNKDGRLTKVNTKQEVADVITELIFEE